MKNRRRFKERGSHAMSTAHQTKESTPANNNRFRVPESLRVMGENTAGTITSSSMIRPKNLTLSSNPIIPSSSLTHHPKFCHSPPSSSASCSFSRSEGSETSAGRISRGAVGKIKSIDRGRRALRRKAAFLENDGPDLGQMVFAAEAEEDHGDSEWEAWEGKSRQGR